MSKLALRWKIEKTELFAKILADPNNGSTQSLACLALNKSSNSQVSRHV